MQMKRITNERYQETYYTETLENGQPLLDPGVILVIAGRKDDAVLGFEIRQRGHVFFKA